MSDLSLFVRVLLAPIPQYVLGCLPAIAIVGASPMDKFKKKLIWVLRCLGCPFTGIFYSVNISGNKISRCLFWLPSDNFRNSENKILTHRPIGIHIMKPRDVQGISIYAERCMAKASVLERFSSIISMYYIVSGAFAGISRATGSSFCEDWPYIPLLLSWTLPSLWRRVSSGNLAVKDPKVEFGDTEIIMIEDPEEKIYKLFTVFLTAFISIFFPWVTLFLAYFTPPKGYLCRSRYITIICSIWSLNSALAYIRHLKGEKDLTRPSALHAWFSFCGFIVAILLFVMGLLDKNQNWWVGLFGELCDITNKCQNEVS